MSRECGHEVWCVKPGSHEKAHGSAYTIGSRVSVCGVQRGKKLLGAAWLWGCSGGFLVNARIDCPFVVA